MTPFLVVLGLAVAISAAARSTWSPCGLSMLSSLTPLAERGRGHRYRTRSDTETIGCQLWRSASRVLESPSNRALTGRCRHRGHC